MESPSLPKNAMMPVTAKLGAVLRKHRDNRCLPRKDVAKGSGLSEPGLADLESGDASSKSDNFERVAATLEMPYVEVVIEAAGEASGWSDKFIVEFHGICARILMKCVDQRLAAKTDGHAVPTADVARPNGQARRLSRRAERRSVRGRSRKK